MSEPDDTDPSDFDSQLRGLFVEAEREIEQRSGAAASVEEKPDRERGASRKSPAGKAAETEAPARAPMNLPQLLRPIVQGIESLSRSSGANAALLQKIDSHLAPGAKSSEQGKSLAGELKAMLEMKQGVNQSMFSALHEELRCYKDGFLLEAVQKPIIRDLITIYDDLAELRRQVGQSVLESMPEGEHSPYAVRLYERLRVLHTNLDHQLEFVIEVLARLDVTQLDPHMGKLNKQTQRAVAVEMAEDPDQDNRVVKVVKRGFQWKNRVLRAEEVVIQKWKEGYLVALQSEAPPAS